MLNSKLNNLALSSNTNLDDYLSEQINNLLTTCCCQLISGKYYELEVAAQAVNALIGENETADVRLYAAIERQDWKEVLSIYQTVFRPNIYQTASEAIEKVLSN